MFTVSLPITLRSNFEAKETQSGNSLLS